LGTGAACSTCHPAAFSAPFNTAEAIGSCGVWNLPPLSGESSGLGHNVTALGWAAAQPRPEVKTAQPEAYVFAAFKFVGSPELST